MDSAHGYAKADCTRIITRKLTANGERAACATPLWGMQGGYKHIQAYTSIYKQATRRDGHTMHRMRTRKAPRQRTPLPALRSHCCCAPRSCRCHHSCGEQQYHNGCTLSYPNPCRRPNLSVVGRRASVSTMHVTQKISACMWCTCACTHTHTHLPQQ